MPENDFNFQRSEDIVNNWEEHWSRTRHCQKHTQLTENHHFQNEFASNFKNLATDDEKWVNWINVTICCLKSMYDGGINLLDTQP